ncbi:MAG: SRPBCC family protein [Solirubrobacteraceae bacterium]
MPVDVRSEIVIQRPRAEVAAFASDPGNATRWCANIRSVEWQTDPPLAVGSRLAFVAKLLGSRLAYTYEVLELQPGERLVMSTSQGPFPMQTTYVWQDADGGATRMQLCNQGEPAKFSKVSGRLIERSIRRSNRKDLRRLKAILESERV